MRVVNAENYDEPRDAISHDWIKILEEQDCEPVLIPNTLKNPVAFVERAGINALILSNGEDVQYRETADDCALSPGRDRTELVLLGWAVEENFPVLAVCRGLQLVNVFWGGKIIPDIEKVIPKALNHIATNHSIDIVDSVTLNFLKISKTEVNSYHRQGVSEETLGRDIVAFAKSCDGVIEGFYIPEKPIIAIQWHPERVGPIGFCQNGMVFHFLKKGPWW